MKTKYYNGVLCILLCLFASMAYAQKQGGAYTVKGVLADSILNESEPYATIRISKVQTPDKAVKLSVTDEQGKFSEKLNAPGEYIISFTSVGKLTVTRNFSVSDTRKLVDLGTVFTAESSKMLKGVEVVAQKPLVKAEIDKISYSIEDDPDSKTNTTLEMLRKVPLVGTRQRKAEYPDEQQSERSPAKPAGQLGEIHRSHYRTGSQVRCRRYRRYLEHHHGRCQDARL